jgi:response regulator RpfG family c-di-GMP phosphodiesterase
MLLNHVCILNYRIKRIVTTSLSKIDTMMNERILIVEDEMIISATIEETLNKIGYANIETAFNAKKAKELMNSKGYDLVLMDVKLGGKEKRYFGDLCYR